MERLKLVTDVGSFTAKNVYFKPVEDMETPN